jgi:hypothetical protein
MVTIGTKTLFFFLLWCGYGFCSRIDTTIVADGSPGPYPLSRLFIAPETIAVERPDSGYVPSFTYISIVNGILFADPVDSGVLLRVRFATHYHGLIKVYSFYEKRYADPHDTISKEPALRPDAFSLAGTQDNLLVTGQKTVGVSVGSFGQVNLEQGLDVRIGGEIRPGTEVSGYLNDRGSSLDGTTREISEFDMIYIAVTDPRFSAVVGDQFVRWPFAGILQGHKKIKGIAASVKPGPVEVQAFGALAGGNFTVQTWRGSGGQGPYAFTGNGEAGFITPISGTIHVTVNGAPCTEGGDDDYLVDFDLGTMTFTARRPILPEDIIRVEYEYKMFDYRRTLSGVSAATAFGDSVVTVRGALWSEIDNKRSPIELTLGDRAVTALAASGDRMPLDTSATAINPRDVHLPLYALTPLYIRKDSLGVVMFIHKEHDTLRPGFSDTLYDVHFMEAADNCGDYVREISPKYPAYIYRYAGPCAGQYTPLTPLSAPQRLTSGEMQLGVKVPLFSLNADIAGQERDKNLFSPLDDNDNLSSAARITALAGNKHRDRRSFWLGGNAQYWSERFDREALGAHERQTRWNDRALDESPTARLLWEASIGATPFAGLSAELVYGQQRLAQRLATDKIAAIARYQPRAWLVCDYDGAYFRHFETTGDVGIGHRQLTSALLRGNRTATTVSYRDEWRGAATHPGSGLMEGRTPSRCYAAQGYRRALLYHLP